MKGRWFFGLVALLMLAAWVPRAAALELKIDGKDQKEQMEAQMIQGTTYVSLRAAAEVLAPEAQVTWEQGRAVVSGDGIELVAKPGEASLQSGERTISTTGKILLKNGSTLIPLRALADVFGATVDWVSATSTALWHSGDAVAAGGEDDLYWLSRIISAESRGEPLEGKIAVGNVVLNRVASPDFPDTIYGVIFDARWGGQFEPVRNGSIYFEPTEESVQAAKMVLAGADAAGDSLYFLAPQLTDNHWTMENREFVTTIGCHWFYK